MSKGIKALVTGASGFIGSRLVAHLITRGIHVRALVRRGLLSDNVCDKLYEPIRADITDPDSLEQPVRGCTLIFHCAWGGNSLEEARRINVNGTRNLLNAAAKAGVRRFVHLSSVAVHGRKLPALLTEEHPIRFDGDAYAVSKAEGERDALELGSANGIEVVVLRPTLVYGPGSPIWLLDYFNRVKNEQLALVEGGQGLANLIYVDDLVDGMWAAAQRPEIAGHAFLMSGEGPVSWRDYIGYFARMCQKPIPYPIPLWKARIKFLYSNVYYILMEHPRRTNRIDLELMPQRSTVSIDKARRMLGYAPRVSIDEGMGRCEAWLRKEGYLPPFMSQRLIQ
jgi:nucleoside-diphosphate-sugar epimerase